MYLIQMLLPLRDNNGHSFPRTYLDQVQRELTDRWGGATAFLRAPAEGAWQDGRAVNQDEMVMLEVMAETLDRTWLKEYQKSLEHRFRQQKIVIRATAVETI